jgi:hypothetical protein
LPFKTANEARQMGGPLRLPALVALLSQAVSALLAIFRLGELPVSTPPLRELGQGLGYCSCLVAVMELTHRASSLRTR